MARPTEQPRWATNAIFVAIGEAWDGLANKADPGAGKKDEGFEPTERPPADFINWILNRIYLWTQYLEDITNAADEHVYPAPKSRRIMIAPHHGLPASGNTWRYNGVTDVLFALSGENNSEMVVSISDHIPSEMTITEVNALIKPGAARSGGNEMEFALDVIQDFTTFPDKNAAWVDSSFSTTLILDDGSTDFQRIKFTGLSITLARDKQLVNARIKSGSTGLAMPDRFYGIEVKFTDVGPRNH